MGGTIDTRTRVAVHEDVPALVDAYEGLSARAALLARGPRRPSGPPVRAGIDAALLGFAREWALGHGSSHLELDSGLGRVDAHRFYERHEPSWHLRLDLAQYLFTCQHGDLSRSAHRDVIHRLA